jgi:hypothetical protein
VIKFSFVIRELVRARDLGNLFGLSKEKPRELNEREQILKEALGVNFSVRLRDAVVASRISTEDKAFVIWAPTGNSKEPHIGPVVNYRQEGQSYADVITGSDTFRKRGVALLAFVILHPKSESDTEALDPREDLQFLSWLNTMSPKFKDTILITGDITDERIELELIQESKTLQQRLDYRNRVENPSKEDYNTAALNLSSHNPVIQETLIDPILQKFA